MYNKELIKEIRELEIALSQARKWAKMWKRAAKHYSEITYMNGEVSYNEAARNFSILRRSRRIRS